MNSTDQLYQEPVYTRLIRELCFTDLQSFIAVNRGLCKLSACRYFWQVWTSTQDSNGIQFAFYKAIKQGRLDLVQALLDFGADAHADNDLPLKWAAAWGHIEIVKFLLPTNDVPDETLLVAINNDKLPMALFIMSQIMKVKNNVQHWLWLFTDENKVILAAIEKGYIQIVKDFIVNGIIDFVDLGDEPIQLAIRNDNLEMVECLEPVCNSFRRDIIINAARRGSARVLFAYLETRSEDSANLRSGMKKQALVGAASNGHIQIVERLLKMGAHFKCDTKFDSMARNCHFETLDLLYQGPMRNDWLLFRATAEGRLDDCKLYNARGATKHDRNHALKIAVLRGHTSIVEYFLGCGAKLEYPDTIAIEESLKAGHDIRIFKLLRPKITLDIVTFETLLRCGRREALEMNYTVYRDMAIELIRNGYVELCATYVRANRIEIDQYLVMAALERGYRGLAGLLLESMYCHSH